jgi:hypothetical protein
VIKDNRNTEYYPSEDDHPSRQGNQKATQEFLPILNIFYNRWKSSAPPQASSQPISSVPTTEAVHNAQPEAATVSSTALFDFESDQAVWQGSADEAVQSSIQCQPDSSGAVSGTQSLRMEFNVLANSWATCSSFFDTPRDLSSTEGIQFMLMVEKPGNVLHMDIFTGPNGERATFARELTYPDTVDKWIPIQIKWNDFKRVEWEADGGTVFSHPEQITGVAFGFPAGDDVNSGLIHIDDIKVISSSMTAEQPAKPQPTLEAQQSASAEQPVQEEQPGVTKPASHKLLPFCGSIALLPLGILITGGLKKGRAK